MVSIGAQITIPCRRKSKQRDGSTLHTLDRTSDMTPGIILPSLEGLPLSQQFGLKKDWD